MNNEERSQGYLGKYGVVIVPPENAEDQWFVTLSTWDDGAESFRGSTDGPLLDTREEALAEAGRVLDWVREHAGENDLARTWQRMQDMQGAEGALGRSWPPDRGPWGDYRTT